MFRNSNGQSGAIGVCCSQLRLILLLSELRVCTCTGAHSQTDLALHFQNVQYTCSWRWKFQLQHGVGDAVEGQAAEGAAACDVV